MPRPPAPPPPRPPKKPAFGDSVPPVPAAVEKHTDSAWDMFEALSERANRRFADTQPFSDEIPLATPRRRVHPRWQTFTMDDAIVETRRNERVCPRPFFWFQVYEMLPDAEQAGVVLPPDGPQWRETPPLSKRAILRRHLEWADEHGKLADVIGYLRKLREDDWFHLNDAP